MYEAVCILHRTDTIDKGINPNSFALAMGKFKRKLDFLTLVKESNWSWRMETEVKLLNSAFKLTLTFFYSRG